MSEIFSKFTEVEILTAVFPEITSLPWKMSSPLRVDNHPSFGIYLTDNHHVAWKDYANKDRGGLMDLLCKYWNCTFNQAVAKIADLLIEEKDISIKSRQIKTLTRKEADELTKIEVKVRPWQLYDYDYWASYGIEKQWLKYAEIYPISHKIITKKDKETGKTNKYIFPSPRYCYVYIERKDGVVSLKIYSPFDKKHKWCSRMDASVWSLWTKIPQRGNNLIIGSSTKDCLNISCQLHIPAICMQGEGYWPKPQVIQELKDRYNKVIVFFDNDFSKDKNPGREDSIKLAEEFGLERVEIPEKYEAKDPSDLFKKYGKEKYLEIMHEILDQVLWKSEN